jgi:hypothetical protein
MKIKLTESELKKIINESLSKILKEFSDNHNSRVSQNSIDNDYEYEGELWDEETGWHGYLVYKLVDDREIYNIEDEDTETLISPEWFDEIIEYDQNYPRMLVMVNGQKRIFDYRLQKFTR